jgi:hypothetical protein
LRHKDRIAALEVIAEARLGGQFAHLTDGELVEAAEKVMGMDFSGLTLLEVEQIIARALGEEAPACARLPAASSWRNHK